MIRVKIKLFRDKILGQFGQITNIAKEAVALFAIPTSVQTNSVVAKYATTELFTPKATVALFATVQMKGGKA